MPKGKHLTFEKYLTICIDSIINQTYKNLEIILVDDGSPDNCGKICDEYEKQDNRNALRFDWLSNDDYKFVKNYSEILSHVMNIRNDKAASALVNGTLQPLEKQKMTNGGDAVAFYRYNDKTDAIAVLHGCGYGNMPEHKGIDCSLNSIRLGGLKNGLQQKL